MYLCMGLCTGAWVPLRAHFSEENWLSLPKQPSVASQIGVGFLKLLLQPFWDFHWIYHVQVLGIQSQPMWIHVSNGSVTAMNIVMITADICSLCFLQSFHPTGWDGMRMSHWELSTPQSLVLCVDQWWVLIPYTTKRCFSDGNEKTFLTVPRREPITIILLNWLSNIVSYILVLLFHYSVEKCLFCKMSLPKCIMPSA